MRRAYKDGFAIFVGDKVSLGNGVEVHGHEDIGSDHVGININLMQILSIE